MSSDSKKPKRPPLPSRLTSKKKKKSAPSSGFSISFSANAHGSEDDSSEGETLGISRVSTAAVKKPDSSPAQEKPGDAATFENAEMLRRSRISNTSTSSASLQMPGTTAGAEPRRIHPERPVGPPPSTTASLSSCPVVREEAADKPKRPPASPATSGLASSPSAMARSSIVSGVIKQVNAERGDTGEDQHSPGEDQHSPGESADTVETHVQPASAGSVASASHACTSTVERSQASTTPDAEPTAGRRSSSGSSGGVHHFDSDVPAVTPEERLGADSSTGASSITVADLPDAAGSPASSQKDTLGVSVAKAGSWSPYPGLSDDNEDEDMSLFTSSKPKQREISDDPATSSASQMPSLLANDGDCSTGLSPSASKEWHPLQAGSGSVQASSQDVVMAGKPESAAEACDSEPPHLEVADSHATHHPNVAEDVDLQKGGLREQTNTMPHQAPSPRPVSISPAFTLSSNSRPLSSLSTASSVSAGGLTNDAGRKSSQETSSSLPSRAQSPSAASVFLTREPSALPPILGAQSSVVASVAQLNPSPPHDKDTDLLAIFLPVPGGRLFRKHIFFATLMFATLASGPGSFVLGLLFGAVVMALVGCLLLQQLVSSGEDASSAGTGKDQLVGEDFLFASTPLPFNEEERLENLIPLMEPPEFLEDAWSMTYNYEGPANHHPSRTTKIYLRLENSELQISTVREDSVSWKKDDSSDDNSDSELYRRPRRALFAHSRTVDLRDSVLRLVPDNLNKRQRWSKKFPIRLTLCAARQDGFVSKTTAGKGPRRTASKTSGNNPYEHTLMFLFAARSRDKMEWFYRMQMASDPSRGCPLLPSLQHDQADYISYVMHLLRDLDLPEHDTPNAGMSSPKKKPTSKVPPKRPEYSPATARHVQRSSAASSSSLPTSLSGADDERHPEPAAGMSSSQTSSLPSTSRQSSPERERSSPSVRHRVQKSPSAQSLQKQTSTQIADAMPVSYKYPFGSLLWFNVGLGRLFYDAWREPRWADKLKVRTQRKLNRIKVPPFVKTLVMKDLDLGHSLPVVQRVYQPQVDGRGLWLDVLLTYKGSFQITIGTGLDFSGTPAEGTGVGAPQTEGATTVGAGEGPASDGDKRKQPSSAGPSRSASPGASRRSRRESTDSSKHRKTESHSRAGTHERSTATGDSSKPANTSDLSDAVAASLARRRRRRMRRRRTFVDSDRSDIDSGDDEGTSLLSEITKKFNPIVIAKPSAEQTPAMVAAPLSQDSGVEASAGESAAGDTAATGDSNDGVPNPEAVGGAVSSEPLPPPDSSAEATDTADPMSSFMSSIIGHVLESVVVQQLKDKVSSIPVGLLINVEAFEGIITVNVPPPPTNVIWFGFRYEPQLKISVTPYVGEQQIAISQLSKLIEDKIVEEVMKRLVLPNMEDLVIPILSSGMEEDSAGVLPAGKASDASTALSVPSESDRKLSQPL